MKKVLIAIAASLTLYGGMWDMMESEANTTFNKAGEYAHKAYKSEPVQKAKEYGSKAWEKSKEYGKKGYECSKEKFDEYYDDDNSEKGEE